MMLDVRIIPNAARTAFTRHRGAALVLKVNAPARDERPTKLREYI